MTLGPVITDNPASLPPEGVSDLFNTSVRTAGEFTAAGVTPVAIALPQITDDDVVLFGLKTAAGTVGAIPTVKTVTPGTGFTVAASASDTSVYNYIVVRIGKGY